MTFTFGLDAWPTFPNHDFTVYQTSLDQLEREVWQWWDGSPVDWATLDQIPYPHDLGFQSLMYLPYSLAAIKLENAIEYLTEQFEGSSLARTFSGATTIHILPFKPGSLHNTQYDVQRPDGTTWSISTTSYWLFWYEQFRSQEFRQRVAGVFRSGPQRDLALADDEWWTGYLEALIRAAEHHRLRLRIQW